MSNKTITETVREMTESAIKAGLPVQPMPDSVTETAESVTEIPDSVNETSESEVVTPEIVNEDIPVVIEPKKLDLVQKLDWNFQEIKSNLSAHIKRYANLVVTSDNLKSMETTQKEIAGLRIKLSKFRLAVKGDMEKPIKEFEQEIKELTGLVESVEKPIKDQLEVYEQKRRETKRIEVQAIINKVSAELELDEQYSSQIAIDDSWLNRGAKKKAVTEEIQGRVCWFLDIQAKDRQAVLFKEQKVEMAKILCQSLSAGLATPLTYEEIESRIDSFQDILAVKSFIENDVAQRKEREDRAAKLAMEQAEQKRNDPPMPPPKSFDPPMPPVPPTPSQTGLPPMPPVPPAPEPNWWSTSHLNPLANRMPIGDTPPIPPVAPGVNTLPIPPIAPAVEKWNCNMHISDVTVAQMEELKEFMLTKGINYSFSGYERRG